jgi:hypothetical protein
LVGAVQEAASCESPGVSDGAAGAFATTSGVPVVGLLAVPVPAALIAATRTSYAVPFVNPVIVAVVEVPEVLQVVHEPEGDTRYSRAYPVMALPPELAGADHDTAS